MYESLSINATVVVFYVGVSQSGVFSPFGGEGNAESYHRPGRCEDYLMTFIQFDAFDLVIICPSKRTCVCVCQMFTHSLSVCLMVFTINNTQRLFERPVRIL